MKKVRGPCTLGHCVPETRCCWDWCLVAKTVDRLINLCCTTLSTYTHKHSNTRFSSLRSVSWKSDFGKSISLCGNVCSGKVRLVPLETHPQAPSALAPVHFGVFGISAAVVRNQNMRGSANSTIGTTVGGVPVGGVFCATGTVSPPIAGDIAYPRGCDDAYPVQLRYACDARIRLVTGDMVERLENSQSAWILGRLDVSCLVTSNVAEQKVA